MTVGLLGGLLGGLTHGLTAVVLAGNWHGLRMNFGDASLHRLTFGLGVGLPVGVVYGRGGREPQRIRDWRDISLWSVLTTGLTIGLVAGIVLAFMSGPAIVLMGGLTVAFDEIPYRRLFLLLSSLVSGLAFGLLLGLRHDLPGAFGGGEGSSQALLKSPHKDRVAGFVAAVMVGSVVAVGFGLMPRVAGGFVARLAVGSAHGEGSPRGPRETWRSDRVFGLVTGLGLGSGFGFGFGAAILVGFKFGFGAGLVVALEGVALIGLLGLWYGAASAVRWPTTLAWLQLRLSCQIPAVALMSFLEDARDRNVLRTVGAVYQFRHATLHDQLAGQTTVSPSTASVAQVRF